mmetsp:Transcript_13010/g.43440  ORF Transcript_13010/g.43440 Transcript_13010/m.43440 type:complete len:228 (+) Transcript_13010:610-1293(+)
MRCPLGSSSLAGSQRSECWIGCSTTREGRCSILRGPVPDRTSPAGTFSARPSRCRKSGPRGRGRSRRGSRPPSITAWRSRRRCFCFGKRIRRRRLARARRGQCRRRRSQGRRRRSWSRGTSLRCKCPRGMAAGRRPFRGSSGPACKVHRAFGSRRGTTAASRRPGRRCCLGRRRSPFCKCRGLCKSRLSDQKRPASSSSQPRSCRSAGSARRPCRTRRRRSTNTRPL